MKIEIYDIFGIVTKEDGKSFVVVGKHKVSEKEFDTIEEAKKYIDSKPYELIFNTCYIISNNQKENNNEN